MTRIAALALVLLLSFSYLANAEPSEADNKWLGAVQSMVAEGKTKISTPSVERVNLLKEWCAQKGYTVQVTRTESHYSIEVRKKDQVAGNK
jgi:putative hemolysin